MSGQKPSGRRRVEPSTFRRSVESKMQHGRRYSRRSRLEVSDETLPSPLSSNIPRKKRIAASRLRSLALCAFLMVLFAVVSTRQKRRVRRRQQAMQHDIAVASETSGKKVPSGGDSNATLQTETNSDLSNSAVGIVSDSDGQRGPGNKDDAEIQDNEDKNEPMKEKNGVLPDQIEVVSRSDIVSGSRLVCRISSACILANGIVSLPVWMTKEDRIIRRCGVGPHIFHSGENGPKGSLIKTVDADLALLIKLMKFKEPSSAMSEFFPETVLHAGFLFDTFDGKEKKSFQGTSSHCITTQNGSACDEDARSSGSGTSSVAAGLKPALFIPKKVAESAGSWESMVLTLLESKYSSAPLTKIFTKDVVDPAEREKTSNVSATCFRSILFSDEKFKDIPPGGFEADSTFFSKANVDRSARTSVVGSSGTEGSEQQCTVTIGILKKTGPRALVPLLALKEKITAIASSALPDAKISVLEIDHNKKIPFAEQVAHMQDVDVLVGGASNSLNNMAFMRMGSTVFEIYPFAWQPSTFEDMSRVLGIRHRAVYAAPQTSEFKGCIEHELFQLRKQNKIEGEGNPAWVKEVEEKWERAASDFVLTGKAGLLLNSDSTGISNFHTRHCARHQSLDFNVHELAKSVLLEVRDICHPQA